MMVALATMLCPILTMAQFNVSGTISEKNNNSNLSGATIKLKGKAISVASNANGKYEFKNLTTGNYLVSVSFLGYKTQRFPFYLFYIVSSSILNYFKKDRISLFSITFYAFMIFGMLRSEATMSVAMLLFVIMMSWFATIAKNNRLLRTPSPFLAALETLGYGPETDPDWLDKVLQEIENLATRRASNSADWM